MEQPKACQRKGKKATVYLDPQEEYVVLKDLESFYWNKITQFWDKHQPPNRHVACIPILKQQKKLNNLLHKICSDLNKYGPAPPQLHQVTKAVMETQNEPELPKEEEKNDQPVQMDVQQPESNLPPPTEELSSQVPPPETMSDAEETREDVEP